MQHGMAGAVGCGARARCLGAAEILRLAAERTLVNFAVLQAIERHAEMLELIHHFARLAAHEFDRVLVAEIIRAFDGVVHMPVPVVFGDISERRGNAALRGNGVRTGGENLGQHGYLESRFGQLQCGAHAGAAGADDYRIEFSFTRRHAISKAHKISADQTV